MEKENLDILELISTPGFCVREGRIVKVNQAAKVLTVSEGTPVQSLLCTGQAEYAAFTEGCLTLTLRLGKEIREASVTRLGDVDVFQLDAGPESPALRALALAAREIRLSLTGVMMSFRHLTDETGRYDPGESAANLERGLCQILRTVGNMSDAETGVPVLRMEYQDVAALFREVMEKTVQLAEAAGIHLRYIGPQQPVFTIADSQLLERAVLNMLSNAMKYAAPGSEIRVTLTRKERVLCLQVTDDGPAIPKAVMSELFGRYQRPLTLEDSKNGLGLGMVLIRTAANAHGGTVLVDHPGNAETRVTMTIAIRQGGDAMLRSDILRVDYAGEQDHARIELSQVLPPSLYGKEY